jgi:MSHA biogenesis protein MshQ
LSNGRRALLLAAPGSPNNGGVDLRMNLNAAPPSGNTCVSVGAAPSAATTANRVYLQGNWTGGAGGPHTQNPTSRATFGVYKGAEEIIYFRENF